MSGQILHIKMGYVRSYNVCLIDVLEHVPKEANGQEEQIKTPYLHRR